jgi:signal recognition particle subunit SRP54
VTGVPIKFIGTGEHLDALEPFNPEGMAGRILGQGDVLALVREARRIVSEKEQEEMERKMREGDLSLGDFREQLEKFAKPGLMQKMMSLLPGMGEINKMMAGEDTEGGMRRMMGIIDSMTPGERRNPKVIDPSRRNRIAAGAGVEIREVNELVRQFETMKPMMQAMAGQGMGGRMEALRQMQDSGMLDPGAQGPRIKKGTGKRLSAKERIKQKKLREKEMRRRRRGK